VVLQIHWLGPRQDVFAAGGVIHRAVRKQYELGYDGVVLAHPLPLGWMMVSASLSPAMGSAGAESAL
jgi:hypothetical protein